MPDLLPEILQKLRQVERSATPGESPLWEALEQADSPETQGLMLLLAGRTTVLAVHLRTSGGLQ